MNDVTNYFFTPKRIGWIIAGIVTLAMTAIMIPKLVEDQPAGTVMVIQSVRGQLDCYTDPGPKWQGLGTVTMYPRRGTYHFDKYVVDAGKVLEDTGKQLQFAEGGTATLYGTVNWEMPLDCKQVLMIHQTFNSKEGVEAQAVSRMVNLAIQLSGSTLDRIVRRTQRRTHRDHQRSSTERCVPDDDTASRQTRPCDR